MHICAKWFVLIISSSILVTVQSAYYYDCEDITTVGKVDAIKISNCDSNDENSKCILKRGTNVTFDLTFKTDEDVDSIKAVVHGVILGEEKDFKLPNDDGCVDSGLTCPVKKGTTVTYSTYLPVKKWYPKISVDVKWELQDKNGKDVVCIMIPSKLG